MERLTPPIFVVMGSKIGYKISKNNGFKKQFELDCFPNIEDQWKWWKISKYLKIPDFQTEESLVCCKVVYSYFSNTRPDICQSDPSLAVKYYIATYLWVNGAIIKVPKPEPQTAMPVAKARFFSKYIDTHTIAGKYMRPNPIPEKYNNCKKLYCIDAEM